MDTQRPDRVYEGTAHDVFIRQCARYETPPDKMTPLQLIRWAIEVEGWRPDEDALGLPTWVGPGSHVPVNGERFMVLRNPDHVMDVMHAHYIRWYAQRNAVLEGLQLTQSPARAMLNTRLCGDCTESFIRVKAKMDGLDAEKVIAEWRAAMEEQAKKDAAQELKDLGQAAKDPPQRPRKAQKPKKGKQGPPPAKPGPEASGAA